MNCSLGWCWLRLLSELLLYKSSVALCYLMKESVDVRVGLSGVSTNLSLALVNES